MYVIHHDLADSCLFGTTKHGKRVLILANTQLMDEEGRGLVTREATQAEISGGLLVHREQRECTFTGPGRDTVSQMTYHAWVNEAGEEVDFLMRPRTFAATDPSI